MITTPGSTSIVVVFSPGESCLVIFRAVHSCGLRGADGRAEVVMDFSASLLSSVSSAVVVKRSLPTE